MFSILSCSHLSRVGWPIGPCWIAQPRNGSHLVTRRPLIHSTGVALSHGHVIDDMSMHAYFSCVCVCIYTSCTIAGWVGLWGFLWWAPSAKRKDHHGVSSGWSSVWHRSNTGLSSTGTQYEQIPIILGVWPFWLTPFFFFWSITFWRAYG